MGSIYASEGNTSEEVTTETNTTGVWDGVLTIQPTQGQMLELLNSGPRGSAPGIPIAMKLKDGSDNDLPIDTQVRLVVEKSGDDSPTVVSVPLDNITDYRTTSLGDQQDEQKIDNFKQELKGGAVRIRDIDEVRLQLKTGTAIDHSNSTFLFEDRYVNERSLDR